MIHDTKLSILWLLRLSDLRETETATTKWINRCCSTGWLNCTDGLAEKTNWRKTKGSSIPNSKLSCCLNFSLNIIANSTIKEGFWVSRASDSRNIFFIPGKANVLRHAAYWQEFDNSPPVITLHHAFTGPAWVTTGRSSLRFYCLTHSHTYGDLKEHFYYHKLTNLMLRVGFNCNCVMTRSELFQLIPVLSFNFLMQEVFTKAATTLA